MDASEFAQICLMVAMILACIAWLAYATDKHDKQVAKLEQQNLDYAKMLADSIELSTQFRRAHWDSVRLGVRNHVGEQEGMFSSTSGAIADGLIVASLEAEQLRRAADGSAS